MPNEMEQPHNPEIERRSHAEEPEDFTVRAEHILADYFSDHPESELRKMVEEKTISPERAYRTLIQLARDPKTNVQRPDILPYAMKYEMMLRREKGQSFTVGVYDIDDFKKINTELSHAGADKVLQSGAQLMARGVRGDDVTRWGGEEFVILYPNTPKQDALVPAERLRSSFEEELAGFRPDGQPVTLTGGLVEYDPDRHANWEDVLKDASRTVLAAKSAGKNRIADEQPEAAA